MSTQRRHWITAPRFAPLLGAVIGAVGGGVYWLGAQIWPTSIAVVLSMLATALLSARTSAPAGSGSRRDSDTRAGAAASTADFGLVGLVFTVLVKYNALMALSAAKLPFALPANLALGLIMIAGHASSRALGVSVLTSPADVDSPPVSHGDLGIALAMGFAPAAVLGIPGLIGLAGAIVGRIAFVAYLRRSHPSHTAAELGALPLTEVCFYLSALAAWAYI